MLGVCYERVCGIWDVSAQYLTRNMPSTSADKLQGQDEPVENPPPDEDQFWPKLGAGDNRP